MLINRLITQISRAGLAALLAAFVVGSALPHAHNDTTASHSQATAACRICTVQQQTPLGSTLQAVVMLARPVVVSVFSPAQTAKRSNLSADNPSSRSPPAFS